MGLVLTTTTVIVFVSLLNAMSPAAVEVATRAANLSDTTSQQRSHFAELKEMTISSALRVSDSKLVVKGRTVLSGVPDNVVAGSAVSCGPVDGIFLGAEFSGPSSRHVVSLGTLRDVRFLAIFRFKLWWMAQRMGKQGRDIPHETQFLLLESKTGSFNGAGDDEVVYVVFLPLTEGPFRACLQGNDADELELCLESGDEDTKSASFFHALFVGAATSDPFAAITGAFEAVKARLRSFRHRTEKKLPGIVDCFGWCTWDAFYQDVTQEGVEAGLRSLTDGGAPPRFVIIDDGWQSVGPDNDDAPVLRLTGIKENGKFQSEDDPAAGIKTIVRTAKENYGLKYVYVWHAITGYWGGVRPGTEDYNSKMKYPKVSPGVMENDPRMKTDTLTVQGLGLVHPKSVYKFYNELHSYLAAAGVDGVKVDVQCILETLGGELGGRVELTRQYHRALDASIAKNFPDNGCIACMSHNTDALYCSKQTAVVRASDDFYPRETESHTIHIASVAYNSVFLGEIMLPDWDMFHSFHPAAEYHASARAISGGPVYVSDAPGKHNFKLLKKLVLPDGSTLRAQLPGRPTRDCLFSDPTRDGISLLKIWNMNKYTGVVGVFNCQGAAWSSTEKKNVFHRTTSEALTCTVTATDVQLISEVASDRDWSGDCVAYRQTSGQLLVLPHQAAIPVSLMVLEHEIFTVSPIKDLAPGFRFAPVGLVDMYNAGGAVVGLTYHVLKDSGSAATEHEAVAMVCMEVKGCGRFGAYSSVKPRRCLLGSAAPAEFAYDSSSGFLAVHLESMPKGDRKVHNLVIEF
ncbi:hypothetical protein ZIOFF_047266 [Zingiber officinale]|uniref:galactinol--sucrose galactosyltransferase n=1 Tax=Zingiber officinale TaxID=94328 RepID=A0A8J5FXI5_ZINOF|nr:hypothetical protein ZIOFF_047266 [Zingiber officinale]